jgi:hypothetical protein
LQLGYFPSNYYFFFFTGAIDHAPQNFYGHFRALARSRPFPDLHWIPTSLGSAYPFKIYGNFKMSERGCFLSLNSNYQHFHKRTNCKLEGGGGNGLRTLLEKPKNVDLYLIKRTTVTGVAKHSVPCTTLYQHSRMCT